MPARQRSPSPASIPKPGFIWWKAQLVERQKKAERAAQPLAWMQAAAAILVAAGILWLLIKNPDSFGSTWQTLADSLNLVGAPLLIVLTCAAAVYLALAAYGWRAGSPPSGKK